MNGPEIIPILGDQLTRTLPSLRGRTKDGSVILMMEVWDETTYVKHHKQKIALILSAMRHFARELENDGWQVDYIRLDDPDNTGSFTAEVKRAAQRHQPSALHVTEASEWRVQQMIDAWGDDLDCPVHIHEDDRFIASKQDFRDWADGRTSLRMEYFYRDMRRKTGILLDDEGGPEGGEWNYDKENRAKPDSDLSPEWREGFEPDELTRDVINLVAERFADHFGSLERFRWAVTRNQAEQAAEPFFTDYLADFGNYQDAMLHGQDQLYHSLLSPEINLGLLDSLALCRRAEEEYHAGNSPLNAVEGFIRQILGWREYVRGFYWLQMPELQTSNALNAQRALPEFYWTGQTSMRCLADCIRSTFENAHAHHIQRLMILGNFALLIGVSPPAVQDWYLAVYADAYEWVELPNVSAMVLFADGGALASKPYAASANYINKMSDYCGSCTYSPHQKTGDKACPFNSLYWHFMHRHREALESNQRIGRVYSNWDRMDAPRRQEYLETANQFLATLKPASAGWARAS
ncbi:cryptochrome/photolyase family protein [Altericroceibacterium endophyticum]|uniref:Cryptochrome/photolyase family protein n=1 Tax=Altericroceibacterium endophyticum TaxID=1808508 RepID=A0A6I4T1P0_9SPHN|nr:cryptochrome/photolyase family protein [Altericroceibacterium endophyticum]MXO64262.1 cryptochrome/photolyase family protein [Altericroceibacterium endophyticum]